jgi:RIO kinase 1
MNDSLAPLLADGVIDEVVARLKSGKEADVWLVRHGAEIVAAKVYKARHARSFKNNAAYKEGRQVRNSRTQRAMDRGSRFGQAAAEDAWKAKESEALHRLHAAGVRVPRPVLFYEGVLLMEVVVDAHGHPAPRLVDAPLAREQAAGIYAELRKQAVGMLACDLVHGDLSPYNVLVGRDGPVVIDMPQVVDAAHNGQAESFFLRDLQNVHRFCASVDPALRAAEGDGREIWRAYVRRELTADFVPTGRAPEPHRSRPAGGGRPDASRGSAEPARQGPRPPGPRSGGGSARSGSDFRGGAQRPGGGAHPGGSRSHDGAHPQKGSRVPPGASGGQRPPDPRARRTGPMPEVIRIDRSLHRAPAPGGGAATPHRAPAQVGGAAQTHHGPAPAGGATGTGDGGRRRRRRRRRPGA